MQTQSRGSGGQQLKILTYNVHSCRGRGGRLDPLRIAEVIANAAPDVIALQELDVGRMRTGGVDQAHIIAQHLRVSSHFHPALHVEEEKYGDAILTALPSRLVKAAPLPSLGEPRGAIWVEVTFGSARLQIINTHLGLRRRERLLQAHALAGHDWLGSADCRAHPAVLAGDFNAVPRSKAFGVLAGGLSRDLFRGRARPTFPSRFPLLRLDHVFANRHARILRYDVIDTPLARLASDHLPLLATVECVSNSEVDAARLETPGPSEKLAAHG